MQPEMMTNLLKMGRQGTPMINGYMVSMSICRESYYQFQLLPAKPTWGFNHVRCGYDGYIGVMGI